MQPFRFKLFGPPRTKKTSSRIVAFGRPCYVCRKRPFQKIIPSEAFEEFEARSLTQSVVICAAIRALGISLPITEDVQVSALVYRDADRGDMTGFMQAIADVIQAPTENRKGMGIIRDDSQIASWDGTRLLIDRDRPRIEIEIKVIEPAQRELLT